MNQWPVIKTIHAKFEMLLTTEPLLFFLSKILGLWMKGRKCIVLFSSVQSLSHVQLFAAPRTAARQAPLSMGFPRQGYWSGLPCPPRGDLPNPENEPRSAALVGSFFTTLLLLSHFSHVRLCVTP